MLCRKQAGFEKLIEDLRGVICDADPATVDVDKVSSILGGADIDVSEERFYIHFDPDRYTRNLVCLDKHFSLLLICWNAEQRTPVHNHGNAGIRTWVSVRKGKICVCYNEDKSHIPMSEGSPVSVMDDSIGDHSTGNCASTGDCKSISLHLYVPPYIECRFSKSNDKDGDTNNSFIPVVLCPQTQQYYISGKEELNLLSKVRNMQLYSNFQQLVDILRKEIIIESDQRHSKENVEHVKGILRNMHFNPREWERYAKFKKGCYTRNLIGYDEKFTILLLCWERGQFSPIHNHAGSNCWVKVLQGQLEETLYQVEPNGDQVAYDKAVVYSPPGVTYICDEMGVHKMGNPSTSEVSISLHIYSPAYHKCHIYNEDEGTKKEVSITTAYGARFPFMEKNLSMEYLPCIDRERNRTDFTTLSSLVATLKNAFSEATDHETICYLLDSLRFSKKEWDQYVHFSPDQYTRNLIAFNEMFSLVLVCWNSGQKTPIHDHGKNGRFAWIKVLEGTVKFVKFHENDWGQIESSTEDPIVIPSGSTIILADDDLGLHQTMNSSSSNVAVSIHLYSPPYVECQFKGKTGEMKMIPVSYCSEEAGTLQKQHSPEAQFQFSEEVFSNFRSFMDLLLCIFSKYEDSEEGGERIRKVLDHIAFNPEEYKCMACPCEKEYTRALVGRNEKFSVFLLSWKPGQHTPTHGHEGSKGWVKILEGSLTNSIYDDASQDKPKETYTIQREHSVSLPGNIVHSTGNVGPSHTYSLHIYSPPFHFCKSCKAGVCCH